MWLHKEVNMTKSTHFLLLLILIMVMTSFCGCIQYKEWPRITSSGVKDLGAGTYYVNVESDYNNVDNLLKSANEAASYKCLEKGRDFVVISQDIIGFSNVQLVFKCIETDEMKIQRLPTDEDDPILR
jgi:hypothetical protein